MFSKKETANAQKKLDTIIGNGTHVNGNLNAEGTLRIDGSVEGEITINGALIIGKNGRVKADIRAKDASIAGEVHGNIFLEGKLELHSTARLYGNVTVAKLIINEGAIFKGQSQMTGSDEDNGSRKLLKKHTDGQKSGKENTVS